MGNCILANGMPRKIRKVDLAKNFQKENIITKDFIKIISEMVRESFSAITLSMRENGIMDLKKD